VVAIFVATVAILNSYNAYFQSSNKNNVSPDTNDSTSIPESEPPSEPVQEVPRPNVTITYSTEMAYAIEGDFSTSEPDPGGVFLIVDMTIQNNGYSTFDNSETYFNVIVDRVSFDVDYWETMVLGNWKTVDIYDGGIYEGTLVFEIPEKHETYQLDYKKWFSSYNIVWVKYEGCLSCLR
jgi:hypothetical protein